MPTRPSDRCSNRWPGSPAARRATIHQRCGASSRNSRLKIDDGGGDAHAGEPSSLRPGPEATASASAAPVGHDVVVGRVDRPPVGQGDHSIGERGQSHAVRDDERGSPAKQIRDGRTDGRLRGRIEMRCRLVEDQVRRVLQERACDGQPLTLSATEATAAFADVRRIAVRQRVDERRRVRRPCRVADLSVGGLGPRQPDVVGHAAVEQVRALWHPGDRRQPRRPIELAEVHATDRDAPGRRSR